MLSLYRQSISLKTVTIVTGNLYVEKTTIFPIVSPLLPSRQRPIALNKKYFEPIPADI